MSERQNFPLPGCPTYVRVPAHFYYSRNYFYAHLQLSSYPAFLYLRANYLRNLPRATYLVEQLLLSTPIYRLFTYIVMSTHSNQRVGMHTTRVSTSGVTGSTAVLGVLVYLLELLLESQLAPQ